MSEALDRGFSEAVEALSTLGTLLQEYGIQAGVLGFLIVFAIMWRVLKIPEIITAWRNRK